MVLKLWVKTGQWVATQFLVGRKTQKLIADKKNVLTLMVTERGSTCVFTQVWENVIWSTSMARMRGTHQHDPILIYSGPNELLRRKSPTPES